jgi:hypothetical protein
MNLKDYFIHQHNTHLSNQQKTEIFHRITQKRFEQSVLRRHFSYKRVGYALMAVMLVFVTFGGFWLERNGGVNNLFFSSNPKNTANVYADYVAEIIEFNGEYTITNGEKSLTSPYLYIHNDDIINLKAGSELSFNLTDKSYAKIVGPAEFSIIKDKNNGYTIHLMEGKFLKIFNESTETDIDIITDTISIHSAKNQALDIQLAKEGEELLIKNNGGAAKITVLAPASATSGDTTKIEKTLTGTGELVSIKGNNINILTDTKLFINVLAKNNISETFSLTTPPASLTSDQSGSGTSTNQTPSEENTPTSTLPKGDITLPELGQILATTTSPNLDIDEKIKSDLVSDIGLENEKKIPTPDQNEVLKNLLNSFFLLNNFESIYTATLKNDAANIQDGLQSLATKMNTLSESFSLSQTTTPELDAIKEMATTLKDALAEKYYIPASQLNQLTKIANRCEYLKALPQS